MGITTALIFGAAGLLCGWFIPAAAQRLTRYKYNRKNKSLPYDPRFTSVWVKILAMTATAALWAATGWFSSSLVQALLLAVILYDALVITVIDIRVHLVPNETVLVMALAGIVLRVTVSGFEALLPALISMLVVMIVFTTLGQILGGSAIGAGDVKLVGAIGLVLGWPYLMYGLVGMSALMVIWCGAGLVAKKMTLKSMLAFAPFMMGGTTFAIMASITGL